MPLKRLLNLPKLLNKKSFFLFGPRATGKSSLIKAQFSDEVPVFDLLRSDVYLRLRNNPSDLEVMISAHPQHDIVVIDEVQRVPMLLNEVHRLIENEGIKFLLTGSSARKLRQHQSNLLAGRARVAEMFPLTSAEIPNFDLQRYLEVGGLPAVYLSDEPHEELYAYVDTYLKEEIQAEAFVRNLPAFTRFLQTSAVTCCETLNFSSLASDVLIPQSTVREYYQILEDTFIGFMLPAWTKSVKRKATTTAKFYYSDIGIRNVLAEIKSISPASDLYGQAFEHFIALELRAYLSYRRIRETLSFWRSSRGYEVDFIIGDDIAIEVKATKKVSSKHLKGLRYLAEENICQRYILVSHDPIPQKHDLIECMPWQDFLKLLWENEIVVA